MFFTKDTPLTDWIDSHPNLCNWIIVMLTLLVLLNIAQVILEIR